MTTALLAIDIQNDYFPGGKMELERPLQASHNAASMLAWFREVRMPLFHIQHISERPGATFFLPGERGVDIHPSMAPREGETVVVKHYPNSFRDTRLAELLRGLQVKRVVVCGMMTHMCVDATARAAADFGFQVIVLSDACATRALAFDNVNVPADHVHAAFMAALKTYGQVMTAQEAIAVLAATADDSAD